MQYTVIINKYFNKMNETYWFYPYRSKPEYVIYVLITSNDVYDEKNNMEKVFKQKLLKSIIYY